MNALHRLQAALRVLTGALVPVNTGAIVPVNTGAVSVRVDDSPGWQILFQEGGPADRPWAEIFEDLNDALTAWRKNFFIRRIVAVIRAYVVGTGITLSSADPQVAAFVEAFWSHRQNRIGRRLGSWCDELARCGELFLTLHTNPVDGISYVRAVPATRIVRIDTAPNDYETELRYGEQRDYPEPGGANYLEPHWWLSPDHPGANRPAEGVEGGRLPPVMLHFAVNRAVGATRGESDLTPVLPWARRYSEWLKDRVALNRARTRHALLDIEIADDTQVEKKRRQLQTQQPLQAGTYIHGPGEKLTVHPLSIDADDVRDDGRALRLAIAAGSGLALHYLAEGEGVNYATAREMGEPTARFLSDRQHEFCHMLQGLVTVAYHRFLLATSPPHSPPPIGGTRAPEGGRTVDDLALTVTTGEVAREDNANLAHAGREVVQALALMYAHGWTDDATAARIAYKFIGEILSDEEIAAILQTPAKEDIEP